MGQIKQAIAQRGRFGSDMRVIYHNRTRSPAEIEAATGAQYVDKGTLLREADHLIVVVPNRRLHITRSARRNCRR